MLDQPRKKVKGISLKKDKKKPNQLESHDGKINENCEEADDEAEKHSSRMSKGRDSDKDEEKDKVVAL